MKDQGILLAAYMLAFIAIVFTAQAMARWPGLFQCQVQPIPM